MQCNKYVSVHIIDIAYAIDKDYVYFVPTELRKNIKIGTVVIVPFGVKNTRVSAVAVDFPTECTYPRTKSVEQIMSYPFDIPVDLIKTCSFMKDRFFCTFGNAFKSIIPPGVNFDTEVYYSVSSDDAEALGTFENELISFIREKGRVTEKLLVAEYGSECKEVLAQLCNSKRLLKTTEVPEKLNELNRFVYSLATNTDNNNSDYNTEITLTKKQKDLIDFLTNYPSATIKEIEEIAHIGVSVVNALVKKALVVKSEISIERDSYDFDRIVPETNVTVSPEQADAIKGLTDLSDCDTAKAALLFGVTGSGKTRVITETVKHVVSKGKQAIILLPEIGLTSQALRSYAAAFGKRLAVIHSMLSIGQRSDTFRKICNGEIDVVVGTRSAVFAPFKNLGIIAIDEEQASTYKSESTPKYNAIDIARFRCAYTNSLMLLASATPSIESFYKAKKGTYTLFELKNRYGNVNLPEVIIEDMRDDAAKGISSLVGTRLSQELRDAKADGKQSILFINRRGHNTHVICRDCGHVYTCPNCSVALTYHIYEGFSKGHGRMMCHYCGYSASTPQSCDVCNGNKIGFSGCGTQKLQAELEESFPDFKILRMDSDTTSSKDSHDRIIDDFADGQSDILIGTQMISKGFDFPNVRISGAVSIDSSLYMNDFRASERTFSLVTQLIGRAGRADGDGKAILQTYNPENETLRLAATQDYEQFFESEIALRKAVLFPPFCSIAVFTFSSESEKECVEFAEKCDKNIAALLSGDYNDVKIIKYGPFKHQLYKIMGKYRQRIIIKYKDSSKTRGFLNRIYTEGITSAPKTVKVDLDTNPFMV